MIREAIGKIVSGESLTREEAAQAMEEIMTGEATPAQFGSFVTALRMKGETVEEITGLASVMRAKANRVKYSGTLVDTCGTGGDGIGTFNVSTAAAFVAAGAGLKIAKHGNRAMSSKCGSADVLEALGVKIELTSEQVAECLDSAGIGFMFAQAFHPAMKYAGAPRREIGIRNVFNILGPLTNPAGASSQVLGVADKSIASKMAQALNNLGCAHALVVHGNEGMDELSISGPSTICEVTENGINTYIVTPEEVGLDQSPAERILGGTASENANIIKEVLSGVRGPRRDIVVLNAAAALMAGGKAATFREGIGIAGDVIDSGVAMQKLEKLVSVSQSV